MAGNYYLLCELFNKRIFVYAIKSNLTSWHYFEEKDSIINVHSSLVAVIRNQIAFVEDIQEVSVDLNSYQIEKYVTDGNFVFKGKKLRTYIELVIPSNQPKSTKRNVSQSTEDLVFIEGKSNPAVFLKEFEKCNDTETENDKLFKIRNFVNREDKGMFSKLFFEGDWSTARTKFLKKYSLSFSRNKKAELDFTFDEETSVRSFVLRKMKALSTYTRLSTESQLEIILNELPVEVSNLFIVHDKMNSKKADILEFCDTIQEMIEEVNNEPDNNATLTANPIEPSAVIQDLDELTCELSETISEIESSEIDSSEVETFEQKKPVVRQKTAYKKSAKRTRCDELHGRPLKIKKFVCESSEKDDDYQSTSSNF